MILVNVPLQISRGIFVHDKLTQMHTILESNCTLVKLSRNKYSKAKKINKIHLSLWKLSSATKRMEALDDFYTDHPFVD